MRERLMWPLYRENARSRSKAHRDPNPDARRWRTWTPATQHFGRWNQCLDVNVLYTLTVSSLITVLAPRGYNGAYRTKQACVGHTRCTERPDTCLRLPYASHTACFHTPWPLRWHRRLLNCALMPAWDEPPVGYTCCGLPFCLTKSGPWGGGRCSSSARSGADRPLPRDAQHWKQRTARYHRRSR